MADITTWVPIRRVGRREWPGPPITGQQRQEVRARLEDGRLQTRAVVYLDNALQPSIERQLRPCFWKQITLLFTAEASTLHTIEMNAVIRTALIETFGSLGQEMGVEVNEQHLEIMYAEFENVAHILPTAETTTSVPIPTASTQQRSIKGDVHLTSAQVRARYGKISDMTLYRWLADAEKGFPKPMFINKRRYWSQALLDDWDANN